MEGEENKSKCSSCNSKTLEIKLPSNHNLPFFLGSHFTLYACPVCNLYKDIQYHDISGQKKEEARKILVAELKSKKNFVIILLIFWIIIIQLQETKITQLVAIIPAKQQMTTIPAKQQMTTKIILTESPG
jgi:hypothetical protein